MKLILASVAAKVVDAIAGTMKKPPQACKVVCIPTAAKGEPGPKDWLEDELAAFRRVGFTLDMMDIDGMTHEEVQTRIHQADVVYVTGGNTFFLLEKMKACGFETIIKDSLKKDTVYVGSSAGTVVCCPDISYIKSMDDPTVAMLDNTKGLGLIDFFVMVHMDHKDFADKAREKLFEMKRNPETVFCLKDHQALLVDENSLSIL